MIHSIVRGEFRHRTYTISDILGTENIIVLIFFLMTKKYGIFELMKLNFTNVFSGKYK